MRSLLVALTVLTLAASVAPARGAILANSLFIVGENQVQDTDYERLIKDPANTGGASIIEVGDILEAIVSFDTINGTIVKNPFTGFGAFYELTAYSRIKVLGIGDADTNGDGIFDGGDTNADGLTNFTFGSGFADLKTAIEVYEDFPTTALSVFDNTVSPAAGIGRATDGTLALTLGFDATKPSAATDPDFWVAFNAPLDISVFTTVGADPALQGGDFFFGLSVLTNPGGVPYVDEAESTAALTGFTGPMTDHDMVGNGSLSVPSSTTNAGWDAETNTKIFFQGVPEPSSLAIWSAVSCFGAAVVWRRRSASVA